MVYSGAKKIKRVLSLSIICTGFVAMAGQIVFIREFLASFSSDELSVGLVLASWLLAGAIGSLWLGRFSDKIKAGYFFLWLCQMSLVFLLPLGILLIRFARQFLQINIGEIIPFHIVGLATFIILLPLCAALGFMFSLSARLYEAERNLKAGSIARVYALESFGAMGGGLFASFILISLLNSFQVISILCFLNAATGLFIILLLRKFKSPPVFFNTLLIVILFFLWLSKGWNGLDSYSLKKQWPGYSILASKNSIYGNITVLKRGKAVSFFENGTRLYTVPDKMLSEEAVHFTLLEHNAPKDILLIGGGASGLLNEILKYPIHQVDYVELDPLVIKMAEELLPSQYSTSLKNQKISIANLDGRYFIKKQDKKYDCIIIHLGEPYTAQLNRFYTKEFFRQIAGHLKEGGIVSFYLNASETYINKAMADFLRSIYVALKTAFSEVKVFPGETIYFLASNSKGILTYDYNLLMQRARERGLDLKYVREYYLFSRLSPEKIAYLGNLLQKDNATRVNYDFRPSAYYYGIISWAVRFKDSLFLKILKSANEKIIWIILSLLLAALLGTGMAGFKKNILLISIGICGFVQSATQLVLLFSFQIIYGYLFYKLGILFTFFMLGLALSSWQLSSKIDKAKINFKTITRLSSINFLFSLFLPLALYGFSSARAAPIAWFGANIFFPAVSLVSGLLGGIIFAMANKIYLDESKNKAYGAVSGLTYGADLSGACFGAAISAVFLIPLIGIDKTCLILALLSLTVSAALLLSDR